jgi:hypothetical protein
MKATWYEPAIFPSSPAQPSSRALLVHIERWTTGCLLFWRKHALVYKKMKRKWRRRTFSAAADGYLWAHLFAELAAAWRLIRFSRQNIGREDKKEEKLITKI